MKLILRVVAEYEPTEEEIAYIETERRNWDEVRAKWIKAAERLMINEMPGGATAHATCELIKEEVQ